MKSVWRNVDGLRMHARVWDDGLSAEAPAVVLLHGLAVSSRYMIPTAERLQAQARVYAPDMPGTGESQRPRGGALGIGELADALAGWMDAMGLQRATLVGNSMGCQVLVEFAIRYAASVERVVLVSPTIDPAHRSFIQQFIRFMLNLPGEKLSLIPLAFSDYLRAGIFRGLLMLGHALDDPIEEKLPLVRAPALVVRGGRDTLVPRAWAEEAARLLHDGRLVVLPRAAHAVNHNSPDELARLISQFIREG